ncbi:LysR substrate-binding domain-containing protein [Pseudorhodoferax sp.]|uniref:LysR substrate-binding domain-containing protein n=1 Tax=Pseudorhodoferax sp. TaxID=1993553 RepID=UPI002DD65F7C|nr:LysR substrate-binding domain-containing protein [Pseudorhodoferax sp.]
MLSIRELPSVRELRALVAVHRGGSFAAAARVLSLSQPAVTALIHELEAKLGVRLFDRTTRTLHHTTVSDEAFAYAERALGELEALHTRMHELGSGRQGRLRVAATSTVAQTLLPAVLARFGQLHPQVPVELDDCAPGQFVDRVAGGHVDFGIGTLEQPVPGLAEQVFIRDHLCVAADRSWAMGGGPSVSWKQLAQHPLVTVKPGYGIRASIDRAAAQAGVSLHVRHEVSLLGTALALAAAGLGVSVLPASLVRGAAHANLVSYKLTRPTIARNIAIVSRSGRTMSGAAQVFCALLQQRFTGP